MIIFFALLLFSAVPSVAKSGLKIQTGSPAGPVSAASGGISTLAQQSIWAAVSGASEVVFGPHTFLGGSDGDKGNGIAVDSSGNIYVTGTSYAAWGTPVRAFAGTREAFVAKLDATGALQWNTFLGSANYDYGYAIAVDKNGNVYVLGTSSATWGAPVNPYSGNSDAFVAKLNGSGALQWNTFLGQTGIEWASAIALDASGNPYISGSSDDTWGSPVNAFAGGRDGFVAKLDTSGALQWNTFLGSIVNDYASGIALDAGGNVYAGGYSYDTWGTPVRPFDTTPDSFAAKLNGSGVLQWNTFVGGAGSDTGGAIAVDVQGNIMVTGRSNATWGSPVNAYPGSYYAVFAAKVNNGGALQWNTFLGSNLFNDAYKIAADSGGNAYVAGYSDATWGSPVRPYSGGLDGFVAKLSASGSLVWNAFLGTTGTDECLAVAAESNGNAYVTGYSNATWGSPIRPHTNWEDAFVTKMTEIPIWKPRHAVGDFDGEGADELAVDFGAIGLYLYDNGSWSQISSANPESLLAADVDGDNVDEILADLGAAGLWLWNAGAWNQLSGVNVEGMAAGDVDADGSDEAVADFGAVGMWLYNGGTWTQLSGVNADYLTAANLDGTGGEEIIGDFGLTGLWIWNAGAWTQLSGVNADYVGFGNTNGLAGKELMGDFGTTGLWLWSAGSGWLQLSGVNADYLITADVDASGDDEIFGDFAATGLWLWDSAVWTQLSGVNADFMIRANVDADASDEVPTDFGTLGLWLLNGGAWGQISGVNPDNALAGDFDNDNQDEIVADFGTLGLWMWNAGAWSQISANNPD
ncbi:MAG: hypothetical protein A2W03_08930 [Candidatus Aminicenantes bacterium RBG_16_63_16]|nr:MAG: hypothetical protein A2W03_08930 [Candidatus Aminicenantes bacterium RBG_16_63_16]